MTQLFSPDGTPWRAVTPAEVNRLKLRGYTEQPPTEPGDGLFHPADHDVKAVNAYLKDNPEDAIRVIAEEKAGQARVTIVGSSDSGN